MKIAFPIITLIAAVSAQNSTGYNITSLPFQLLLHGNVSGTLHACDVGSSRRSLVSFCYYDNDGITTNPTAPTPYDTFNFNSSVGAQAPSDPGTLTWFRPVHNGRYPPIPYALYFQDGGFDGFGIDDATPILQPDGPWRSRPSLFTFDDKDELMVLGSTGTKRWFLCWHNFSGFQYNMLVFGVGKGKPENPPCVVVGGVKRGFI